jgi:hypothetical protein
VDVFGQNLQVKAREALSPSHFRLQNKNSGARTKPRRCLTHY